MKHVAAALFLLLAGVVAGCGGNDTVEPVASTSCTSLLYEGEGEPDLIVVSDLPRRGELAEHTKLLNDAIEFVFRERGFRAGEYRVGYQSCNGVAGNETYDLQRCTRNARDYVATEDVVGIIGPWPSGCALEQIPVVSRREAGPLAMISPTNTAIGLTRTAQAAALYPDGVRSYLRVITHDSALGIAAAHLAERQGARRVAVLRQVELDDPYARGITVPFVASARSLGLDVVRFDWPLRKSYRALAASVAAARPEAVFLAGLPEGNAGRLVEDLRAALGPGVTLIAPDSFHADDIAEELGGAGEGMRVVSPGVPPEQLPPAGKQFLRELGVQSTGALYVSEAAQAAEVFLDSIARSDGTRPSVVDELFETEVTNGFIGSFSFDRYGDIAPAPVGIYRFEGGEIVLDGVIRAPLGDPGR